MWSIAWFFISNMYENENTTSNITGKENKTKINTIIEQTSSSSTLIMIEILLTVE
jgi:hypothetical protein